MEAFQAGVRDLAAGHYGTRVTVARDDELGTPLAALRVELEALQDGVRPLERAALDSLYADTLRLRRLVDDLYELSMTDLGALSYRKTEADPAEVLEADIEAFAAHCARRRGPRFERYLTKSSWQRWRRCANAEWSASPVRGLAIGGTATQDRKAAKGPEPGSRPPKEGRRTLTLLKQRGNTDEDATYIDHRNPGRDDHCLQRAARTRHSGGRAPRPL